MEVEKMRAEVEELEALKAAEVERLEAALAESPRRQAEREKERDMLFIQNDSAVALSKQHIRSIAN
jgi:hypothetical protein